MPCHLEEWPKLCFEEHRRRLTKLTHHRESIECNYCHFARQNAEIAYTPELDPHDTASPTARKIHDANLKPDCPVCRLPVATYRAKMHRKCLNSTRTIKVNEPKTTRDRTKCSKGHSRAIYGRPRKDGGYACRLCTAIRKRAAYQSLKAASA